MSRKHRVKISKRKSLHQHFEATQTFLGRSKPLQTFTGSEIEAEEHEKEVQQKYHGKMIQPSSAKMMPIFLKIAPKLEGTLISIPPPHDDQKYKVKELICQPLNAAINMLTPSLETFKDTVQPIYGSRKQRALKIHLISSPIYQVQYECSPPSQKIETLHLPNKKCVAELLLKPPTMKRAEIFDQMWQTAKYEVSYGRHSAIPTTIPDTMKQRITKITVEKRKGRLTSALNVMPKAPIQIKQVIKAPPINTIELCCIDSTVEAKKVKEIYVEEAEYQVIRTLDYSYTESTVTELSR